MVTFLLSIAFTFFQFKGWSSYYKSGNAIKSFVTFVYGQYGKDFKVMKGEDIIDFDGENYVIENQVIEDVELEKIKGFLGQICGNSTSFREANFNLFPYLSYVFSYHASFSFSFFEQSCLCRKRHIFLNN